MAEKLNDINGICHFWMKYLPQSPLYPIIQDQSLPKPLQVWKRIAFIQKEEFDKRLKKEVDVQRTRLGADPVELIRFNVEKELFDTFHVN